MTHKIGHISYIKLGGYVQYGGYLWSVIPDVQIATRYTNNQWGSDSSAMNVCKGSTTCTGVNMVDKNRYQLGQGNTLVKAPGKKVFLQGDEVYTASGK